MYVCICQQVTDHEIRDICRDGYAEFDDVKAKTGVSSQCGKCGELAKSIVEEFNKSAGFSSAE